MGRAPGTMEFAWDASRTRWLANFLRGNHGTCSGGIKKTVLGWWLPRVCAAPLEPWTLLGKHEENGVWAMYFVSGPHLWNRGLACEALSRA